MVVKRPTGHKLIDQAIAAEISEAYGGGALVTFPYHGLSDGDTIYIDSDIDEYNGFWYVTVVSSDTFKISEHSEAEFVEYYQDADIDYYQTQEHEWSSIFLPIVYKITNNLWPVNSTDTARTVSSSADDNGFTDLTLSGSLRGSVKALEFVQISGASDDDLNGVWQIVEVISTSHVVINLPYDADNSFSGATVQYYYNNFQNKVKIYAGLPSDHPWEHKKPFEEVAELSLTPDENNEAMFSVSDYIQSKVKIQNNLTLYSLPLNLDAFTGFYISVGESYDQSDNYSLYTSESPYVDDTFEGYAIAGKLPFKNIYAGDYADYVYTSGYPGLWLTNRDRLLGVEGYYFDVSFIKNISGPFHVTIQKYLTSDYAIEEIVEYADQGIGVYRIPLTLDANYNSFCITAETESHTETIEIPPTPIDLSAMTNEPAGGDLPNWTLGAEPFIIGQTSSDNLSHAMAFSTSLKINYRIRIENKSGPFFGQFFFESLDGSFNAMTIVFITANTNGIYEGQATLPAPGSPASYVTLSFANVGAWDMYVEELSIGDPTTEEIEVPGETVTQELCIDILEACDVEDGFVSTEGRRLLEDGGYRLLE